MAQEELLDFTRQVIEFKGGIAEKEEENVLACMPENLARDLSLPAEEEEVRLGQDSREPLLYGSPLLDRLIDLSTQKIPLVYGQVDIPYLKKGGFEHFLAQDLSFPESSVSITNKAETRSTYMILTTHYLALSDERKEGLVSLAIQEQNAAVVKGLEEARQNMDTHYFASEQVPPHFPAQVDKILDISLPYLKEAVYQELKDFQKSMQRRLQRDVRNLREYYEALAREMRESLERPTLSQAQKEERQSKIKDLPLEEERKIKDQQHKYNINVTIKPAAILRLLMDVVKVEVHIRHRKWQKTQHIVFNPLTHKFDPLTCQKCGQSIRFIYPQPVKENLQIFCSACKPRK